MPACIQDESNSHKMYEFKPGAEPNNAPPGLEDIWSCTHKLLGHLHFLRSNERSLQAQQYGMIRDGCLLLPSVFPGRVHDLCSRSWFHESYFYYLFEASEHESYFWISGVFARGYSLDTIWFPGRRLAVTINPLGVDCARLARFDEMLTRTPAKPIRSRPWTNASRTAVVSSPHLMHMLWNELPALERLTDVMLPDKFNVAVLFEPFGPMKELFPEFADRIKALRHKDILHENAQNGLVLGLGAWTVTNTTQRRLHKIAARHTQQEKVKQRDLFKKQHYPIFWLSVKPPKRTLSNQSLVLASVINALQARYPQAGFILDGACHPFDFPANENYAPWFHNVLKVAFDNSKEIITAIIKQLRPATRKNVIFLNGVSACEEITWGAAATFYICHGGTMQNKIGWIHRIPGFVHSNRNFLESFRRMPVPVEDGPACYFPSEDLIVDDNISNYSVEELARKDQNYKISSVTKFSDQIMAAVAASIKDI